MKAQAKGKRRGRPRAKSAPAKSRSRKPSARRGRRLAPPTTVRPAKRPPAQRSQLARAAVYPAQDRQALALLMLPFLLMASGIWISQAMRSWPDVREVAAIHLPVLEPERESARLNSTIAAMPPIDVLPAEADSTRVAAAGPPSEIIASLAPIPEIAVREEEERGPPIATVSASDRVCKASDATPPLAMLPGPADFGRALAAAARAQTGDLVIYNDRYRTISYPMGDVPALYGVCTDVVIRAYRALGIDLQMLVHAARLGTGDASIDHRRTEVLRRYFVAYGQSLPVTEFAEDYSPGDIVTYYRPQNRRTPYHIAIVSDVVAPSGRPMIIHNRGWGPQLEDALFVNQITGHYRYGGEKMPAGAARELAKYNNKDMGAAARRESAIPMRASFQGGAGIVQSPIPGIGATTIRPGS